MKFNIVLLLFVVVLFFAIYVDTTIYPELVIEHNGQTMKCAKVKYTNTDPDYICFGDKPLFWGLTYYAPLVAVYDGKHIDM